MHFEIKKYLTSLLLLLIFICAVTACDNNSSDYSVSLQNDGVRFGMSFDEIKDIKGEPLDALSDYCDTPFAAYTYAENVFELKADTTYIFDNKLLSSELTEVEYNFEPSDYDTAMDIAKQIYDNVKSNYKSKDGFYEEEFDEENDSFYASLGVTNGACGVSIIIKYSDSVLSVSAINQK